MNSTIWFDGTLMPVDDAHIRVDDRGVLYGDGIFETMRVTEGTVPLLDRHLARLAEGCRILRLPPPDRPALSLAIADVIEANALVHGVIRLTCTRGPGPRGLMPPMDPAPTILIAAFSHHPPRLPPIRVHISRQVRDGGSVLSRIKTLNYLPSILARFEAADAGADEALLRNSQGGIACGCAGTLVVLDGGRLLTPAIADGAMEGISRGLLLEQGLAVEQAISTDFRAIQGAWIISALSIRPIGTIGRTPLPVDKGWTIRIRECIHPAPVEADTP